MVKEKKEKCRPIMFVFLFYFNETKNEFRQIKIALLTAGLLNLVLKIRHNHYKRWFPLYLLLKCWPLWAKGRDGSWRTCSCCYSNMLNAKLWSTKCHRRIWLPFYHLWSSSSHITYIWPMESQFNIYLLQNIWY